MPSLPYRLRRFGVLFSIVCATFSQWSCSEIAPIVPPLSGTSTYGERRVLVEEFTGVRCVNCPAGSAEIENLKAKYGDNLIPISIHAGFFAQPYPDNRFDFRTAEGTSLQSYLEEPIGYPTAVVNRQRVNNSLQLSQSLWSSQIEQTLKVAPDVQLSFQKSYDSVARKFNVRIKVLAIKNLDIAPNLTVCMTEDGITDAQLTPAGKKLDYVHRHVLRRILTNASGTTLPKLNAGASSEQTFDTTLPDTWVASRCHFVAFVHRAEANDKTVLQATEGLVK